MRDAPLQQRDRAAAVVAGAMQKTRGHLDEALIELPVGATLGQPQRFQRFMGLLLRSVSNRA